MVRVRVLDHPWSDSFTFNHDHRLASLPLFSAYVAADRYLLNSVRIQAELILIRRKGKLVYSKTFDSGVNVY